MKLSSAEMILLWVNEAVLICAHKLNIPYVSVQNSHDWDKEYDFSFFAFDEF